jgi:hypothetical protein
VEVFNPTSTREANDDDDEIIIFEDYRFMAESFEPTNDPEKYASGRASPW